MNYTGIYSGVAQLVERLTVNQWVTGSSPVPGAGMCSVRMTKKLIDCMKKIDYPMYISILAAIASIIFFFLNYNISIKTFEIRYRPYVGVEKVYAEITQESINCTAVVINTGIVPANNLRIEHKFLVNNVEREMEITGPEEVSMLLIPIPAKGTMNFSVPRNLIDKEWIINLKFNYDGVKTKNYESYTKLIYKPKTQTFETSQGYVR